jgi:hypothetical protein
VVEGLSRMHKALGSTTSNTHTHTHTNAFNTPNLPTSELSYTDVEHLPIIYPRDRVVKWE